MGKKGKGDDKASGHANGKAKLPSAAVSDPRFAAVHKDPRFQRIPQAKKQVTIDKRFKAMLEKDSRFQEPTKVDKRGRLITGSEDKKGDLKKFYRLKDEDPVEEGSDLSSDDPGVDSESESEEGSEPEAAPLLSAKDKGKGKMVAQDTDDEEDGDSDSGGSDTAEELEEGMLPDRPDYARGQGDLSSSDDDSEEEEEEQTMVRNLEEAAGGFALWEGEHDEATVEEEIELTDATARFAVLDLDWDRVKAVDIFVVLQSFAPKGGRVTQVTVYPSDFGLERMAREEKEGPLAVMRSLRKQREREDRQARASSSGVRFGGSDDEGGVQVEGENEEESGSESEEEELGKDKSSFAKKRDNLELRAYERSRLRYFYAVAECDSVKTARNIYNECDGSEFEPTGNKLDLRYIPDDTAFDDREPRDEADGVPPDYAPPELNKHSLQHTNVQLGWDRDDEKRKKLLRRKVTDDDIKEDDMRAFMGSSSDESDDEGVAAKYRALLGQGGEGGDSSKARKNGTWSGQASNWANKNEGDMEVKFKPGLADAAAKALQRREDRQKQATETVWEQTQRKMKEKKAARRKAKAQGEDADADEEEAALTKANKADTGFNDDFFADDDGPVDFDAMMEAESASDDEVGPRAPKLASQRPSTTPKGKAAKEAARKAKEREKAELEMLLIDDDQLRAGAAPAVKGPSGKEERKKEKQRAKKLARLQEGKAARSNVMGRRDDEDDEADAAFDVKDNRFGLLFNNPDFALDPTDPRFKKTDGTIAILEERNRRKASSFRAEFAVEEGAAAAAAAGSSERADKNELKSVVANLKRKASASKAKAAEGLPSKSKMPKKVV